MGGRQKRSSCEAGSRAHRGTQNEVHYSAASLWEVAIKAALKRSDFDVDTSELRAALMEMGFIELAVTGTHAAKVGSLPPIHRDPFDRMLIAQCMSEPLLLLTNDDVLAGYGDFVRVVSRARSDQRGRRERRRRPSPPNVV